MTYEFVAFAGFGIACLALFAGAKSLDDRDRDHDLANRGGTTTSPKDLTSAFPIVDGRGRTISRPPERISRPHE